MQFPTISSLILALALSALAVVALVGAQKNERQIRRPVPCEQLKDGNYVWGCSRFYSICSNGMELPMQCYSGLKLNPENNQCDSQSNIDGCQQNGGGDQLYRAADPFTCTGNPDGEYESGTCAQMYFQCAGGQQIQRNCPNALVYSAKAGACDFASKCTKAPKRSGAQKVSVQQKQQRN